ncbi:YciI family protein [Billgrantia lactosivorans]|uniref:YciI family protein n=1 Tax=Billgrantia lactosivorans TaxID=2185141 RepID=UPI001FE905F8|nr:YciI family protein [Halomonas lactosivorans]
MMHLVFLRFSEKMSEAGRFMEGHKQWLERGFDEGVFLVSGSIQPKQGGAILAHNVTLDDLHRRVNEDPFVAEGVVSAEIIEVAPSKADERLAFLLS